MKLVVSLVLLSLLLFSAAQTDICPEPPGGRPGDQGPPINQPGRLAHGGSNQVIFNVFYIIMMIVSIALMIIFTGVFIYCIVQFILNWKAKAHTIKLCVIFFVGVFCVVGWLHGLFGFISDLAYTGYIRSFECWEYDYGYIKRTYLDMMAVGTLIHTILLDLVLLSWSRINSLHGVADFYTILTRILTIVSIVKHCISVLMYVVHIIFFIPNWSTYPIVATVVWMCAGVAEQLILFIFLCIKVSKALNEQKNMSNGNTLRVVRTKIITTFLIIFICGSLAYIPLLAITGIGFFFGISRGIIFGMSAFPLSLLMTILEAIPCFWVLFVTYNNSSIISKLLKKVVQKVQAQEEKAREKMEQEKSEEVAGDQPVESTQE